MIVPWRQVAAEPLLVSGKGSPSHGTTGWGLRPWLVFGYHGPIGWGLGRGEHVDHYWQEVGAYAVVGQFEKGR